MDYKSYYPGHHIYFVVKAGKADYYERIFTENLSNYSICVFEEDAGLKEIFRG